MNEIHNSSDEATHKVSNRILYSLVTRARDLREIFFLSSFFLLIQSDTCLCIQVTNAKKNLLCISCAIVFGYKKFFLANIRITSHGSCVCGKMRWSIKKRIKMYAQSLSVLLMFMRMSHPWLICRNLMWSIGNYWKLFFCLVTELDFMGINVCGW